MRRTDKEITNRDEIESIIRRSLVCRLAMCDGSRPYIVPMCFGLHEGALYFHCANEGRKLDIIRTNPNVCFEFDIDTGVVGSGASCNVGMKYRSVIGLGTAVIVENEATKRLGLEAIVRQYAGRCDPLPQDAINKTTVIEITITELTGKRSD